MLFAYVDGYDLAAVARELEPALSGFADSQAEQGLKFINHQEAPDARGFGGDLPPWQLGLNFPASFVRTAAFDQLLLLLQHLAASTGREFVIGVEQRQGFAEDVVDVGPGSYIAAKSRLLAYLASLP